MCIADIIPFIQSILVTEGRDFMQIFGGPINVALLMVVLFLKLGMLEI